MAKKGRSCVFRGCTGWQVAFAPLHGPYEDWQCDLNESHVSPQDSGAVFSGGEAEQEAMREHREMTLGPDDG